MNGTALRKPEIWVRTSGAYPWTRFWMTPEAEAGGERDRHRPQPGAPPRR